MTVESRALRVDASLAATARPDGWLDVWMYVQWACLASSVLSALFLLVHSVAFHRQKRRVADFLLCVIGLSDLCFATLETLKNYVNLTYVGILIELEKGHVKNRWGALELITSALSRFFFFMSLYWIANLSILMRLGKIEDVHVRRSFAISIFLSAIYGTMHASLQSLDHGFAYHMNAFVVMMIQVVALAAIVMNVEFVRQSRFNENHHGRNVIRRLTGYCICAGVFTLPFALVLTCSSSFVAVGAITETLNYLVPITNAVLFGTSLMCCANSTTLPQDKTHTSKSESTYSSSLVGPTTEMITEGPVIKIGEGSSAIVYRTQWLGITVAMKCIRVPGIAEGSEDLYMTHMSEIQTTFREEAALAAQLRHPNITLFIKLGTYKGAMCLVNEYCSRGSLRDVLKANPLMEWSTKVRLAFESAKGLAFMHNREPIYLHRDIKASNILVTEDWTAKIADFGISRIATDFTAQKYTALQSFKGDSNDYTTFAGTWRWNAPEVMENPNECRFNRATDVYSFGVALWELLTNGATPFGDVAFDHQVRQLVANGERPTFPPVYLRRAPGEFVEIIKACWDQDPDCRPSAQEVMLRLGSLSYTLLHDDQSSFRATSRQVFSDNYYQAIDSARSCVVDI